MDGGAARPSSEGAAVGDLAAARRYVERVGLCLFQPAPAVGLPSLYEAVAGRPGPPPPWGSRDPAFDRTWRWKDALLSDGRILVGAGPWSGRFFVAGALVPAVIAASPAGQYGAAPEDFEELYADGRPGREAHAACR